MAKLGPKMRLVVKSALIEAERKTQQQGGGGGETELNVIHLIEFAGAM